jgi:hypothetical protein
MTLLHFANVQVNDLLDGSFDDLFDALGFFNERAFNRP